MKKTCSLIGLFLIGLFVLVTGCNNTETSSHQLQMKSVEGKFLDLTGMPSEDVEILTMANERIKPYVEVENGLLVLIATSGEELDISDQLFRIFVNGIAENNRLIEAGVLFVVDGDLYPTEFKMNLFPRKRSFYEIIDEGENYKSVLEYDYWGATQTTTYTNTDGALDYYEQYSNTSTMQLAIAGVIGIGMSKHPPALGAMYTAGCTAAGLIVADTSSKILEAARQGGITVRTMTRPGSMPGDLPITNTIVYDKNGKTVVQF